MQYVLPKTFQARCNMVRKSERKSASIHQGGVIQAAISGNRAAITDGAPNQDLAGTFDGFASLDPAREHDIHLASFDFVLGPGEAHEVSPQKYSCVASVDARLQAWFLPMSSLVSAHLRVQDRRLHKDIVVDSLVQSTEIFQFRVQWRPPYNPTDVQIVKLKASVGEALREMTDDSGGRTEIVRDFRDLDPAVASIADELTQQYYLGYLSPEKKDGLWHSIRVELRNRNYRVRARRGYVAS